MKVFESSEYLKAKDYATCRIFFKPGMGLLADSNIIVQIF